jgi:hypothetical protein
MARSVEVREMRDAETTLAIIRERGKKGLHLEDVYRQFYNPDLFLRAYGRIYKNTGAMTQGTTEETVDGMSMGKIQSIIDSLRGERYRWCSRSQQSCNTLYSMRGVRLRAHQLTGVLSLIRWDVE